MKFIALYASVAAAALAAGAVHAQSDSGGGYNNTVMQGQAPTGDAVDSAVVIYGERHGTNNGTYVRGPIDDEISGPITKETPNTIHYGSPTQPPDVDLAITQAPLNQAPPDNGQPPAGNQPVTETPEY